MENIFEGSQRDEMLDRAALIVALVQGRESATRTDYMHPRIKDVVAILKEIAAAAPGDGAGKPGGR